MGQAENPKSDIDRTITSTDHGLPFESPVRSPEPLLQIPPGVYQYEKEVGRGGVGVVRSALDRRLSRRVALKQLQNPDAASRARFEREMRLTASLEHPGIVPVHEAGLLETGEPYYAMKLLEGRTLKAVIADCKTVAERLRLVPRFVGVVEAIAYAHSKNIIHRDLKPSNIVLGEFGETIVIDWGVAKYVDAPEGNATARNTEGMGAEDLTFMGQIVGTPAYMAPEQARGEELDARADVYALGAVLRQILTGSPPYKGSDGREVLAQVLTHAPPPLDRLVPEAPADLRAVAEKAMARDRHDRYASAKELLGDLSVFLDGRLVSAYSYGATERVKKWVSLHRAVATTIAVAFVFTVGLCAFGVAKLTTERDRAVRNEGIATDLTKSQKRKSATLLLEQADREIEAGNAVRALELLAEYPTDGEDWNRLRDIARRVIVGGVPKAWLADARGTPVFKVSRQRDVIVLAEPGHLQIWRAHDLKRPLDLPTTATSNQQIAQIVQLGPEHPDTWLVATVEGALLRVIVGSDGHTFVGEAAHPCANGINDVAELPEQNDVAVACVEGSVMLFDPDTATTKPIDAIHGRVRRLEANVTGGALKLLALADDGVFWVVSLGTVPLVAARFSEVVAFDASSRCAAILIIDSGGVLSQLELSSLHANPLQRLPISSSSGLSIGDDCTHVLVRDSSSREIVVLDLGGRGKIVYRGAATDAEFSADGRTLWTGGEDGAIGRIDLTTGWRDRWRAGNAAIRAVRETTVGLLVLGRDLTVWDSSSATHTEPLTGAAVTLATSSDDESVVVGEDNGAIEEYYSAIGVVRTLNSPHTSRVLVRAASESTFFSAGFNDGCVYRWNFDRVPEFGYCEFGGVLDIGSSGDGKRVYTISPMGRVSGFDFQANTGSSTIIADSVVRRIATGSYDGHVLVGTQGGSVYVFSSKLELLHVLRQEHGAITHVAGGPDGLVVALTVSGDLVRWDSAAGSPQVISSCKSSAWRGWTGSSPFTIAAPCQSGLPLVWPNWSSTEKIQTLGMGLLDVDFGSSGDEFAFSATGGQLEVISRKEGFAIFLSESMGAPHNIELLPRLHKVLAAVSGFNGLAVWDLSSVDRLPTNNTALHGWLQEKVGDLR